MWGVAYVTHTHGGIVIDYIISVTAHDSHIFPVMKILLFLC